MLGIKKHKVFTPAKTVGDINFKELQRRINMALTVKLKSIVIRFHKSPDGIRFWIAFSDKSDYMNGYETDKENWITDAKEMLNDSEVEYVELGVSKNGEGKTGTQYGLGYLKSDCKKIIEERLKECEKMIRLK